MILALSAADKRVEGAWPTAWLGASWHDCMGWAGTTRSARRATGMSRVGGPEQPVAWKGAVGGNASVAADGGSEREGAWGRKRGVVGGSTMRRLEGWVGRGRAQWLGGRHRGQGEGTGTRMRSLVQETEAVAE